MPANGRRDLIQRLKVNEEATIRGTQVFVNAELFQNGKWVQMKDSKYLHISELQLIVTKALYMKISVN